MKNVYKIFSLAAVALIFISFSSSHPVGRSGAPGDGLCSDCHGGSASFGGTVELLGLPSTVVPGQIYNITIELESSSGNPVRGGFQVVALRDQNDTQAGLWSGPDNSSSLKTAGGRVYFGHEPFRSFGAGNTVSWDAQWEAPNITDNITFYIAGNLANGNGSSSGDEIVTNQLTVESTAIQMLELAFQNVAAVTCPGDSDGSAEVLVSGGVPPYDIEWDNGESGPVASMLDGGIHFVSVTDDNGMMVSDNVIIPEPSEIEADIFTISPSCFGEKNGEIEIQAFGGTGDLDCSWFTLGDGCVQDGLEAGLYFLTITDANNCIFETEVEITEPEELVLTMSSMDATPLNNDGSAMCVPSGGNAPYQFAWSNGAFQNGLSSRITGLSQGVYSVSVTDSNGCEQSASVTVGGVNCAISLSLAGTPVLCHGDTTGIITSVVSNASAPVSYQWSNGSTASMLNAVPSGNYSLTVTDANACTATAMTQITQPDSLSLDSLMIMDNICSGDSTGSISFVLNGGTAPYDLNWSNGIGNDTIFIGNDTIVNIPDTLLMLGAGMYRLSITDANSCMLVDSFTIAVSDTEPPVVDISPIEWLLTDDGTSAPLELEDLGAVITDNCELDSIVYEARTFDCDELGTQTLEISVFDSNGNVTIESFDVEIVDVVNPIISCNNSDLSVSTCEEIFYQAPSATDNCNVASLVQIAGQSSGTLFPDGTTVNTFLATDSSGNTSSCSFSITVDSDLQVDIVAMDASCTNDDGFITVDVSGGTAPYEIFPDRLDGLSAGTYTVSVTDATGCFYMEDILVGRELADFTYSVTITDVSCKGGRDGAIDVIVDFLDTTEFYIISINDGAIGHDELSAGTYTLSVEESGSGCILTEEIVITEPEEELVQEITDFQLDPCTMLLIDSERVVTGGTAPYELTEVQDAESIIFTATDANGCRDMDTLDVSIPDEFLFVSVLNISDSDNGSNGSVSVLAGGGVPPYSYTWLDEAGTVVGTESDIEGLAPGTYTLIVSDAAGCQLPPSTFNIDMISSTASSEKETGAVISPNPAHDWFAIEYGTVRPQGLSLFSIDGSKCLELRVSGDSQKVDISDLDPGMYVLVMTYNSRIETARIIKY